jgi:hypothetical protein
MEARVNNLNWADSPKSYGSEWFKWFVGMVIGGIQI